MKLSKHFLHACLPVLMLALPLPAQSIVMIPEDTVLSGIPRRAALLLDAFGETERALEVLEDFGGSRDLLELKVKLLVKTGKYRRADSLLGLVMQHEGSGDRDVRIFARAVINFLAGDYRRSLEFAESMDEDSLAVLADYGDYVRMRSLAGLGRYTEAQAVGMKILNRRYSKSLTPLLESDLLKILTENREDSLALLLIERVKKRLKVKRELMEFLSREIELHLEQKNIDRAKKIVLEIAEEYSNVPGVLEILDFAESRIPLDDFESSELLTILDARMLNNDAEPSRRIINELKKRKLEAGESEKLRLEEARVLYLEGNYRAVLTLLKKGFTIGALTRDSLLLKARALRRIGNLLNSAVTYRHLALNYPSLSISPEALYVASELFEKANYRSKSREIAELLMEKYSNNYYGGLAALRLSQYYMKRKNYRKSLSILKKASGLSSKWREENLYYQAKAYEKLGDEKSSLTMLERLRKVDKYSFYLDPAIRDRWSLPIIESGGRVVLYGPKGLLNFILSVFKKRMEAYEELERCIKPGASGIRYLSKRESFERANIFLRFGFTEWAENELEVTNSRMRNNPSVLFELGKLYNSNAMAWQAVRTFATLNSLCSRRIRTERANALDVLAYPIVFPGLVFEYCAANDLLPNLVFSLIREESRFHHKAISRAGAIGLMQLMPETGEMIADELGYPMEQSSLFNPQVNIALGMEYASRLLDKCNGNYYMMLAAYNAGFSNAKRWFGGAELNYSVQEKVDRIDFKETRNYIRRVIESSHVYSALYETRSTH